jgi:hypothetical protein
MNRTIRGWGSVLAALAMLAWPALAGAGAPHVWTQTWDPRPGYDVYAVQVIGAPGGGVYAATSVCDASHMTAGMAVARYASDGRQLWSHLWFTKNQGGVGAIASDAAGNLIVAGQATYDGAADWIVMKLRPGGRRLWTAHLAGPLKGGTDWAYDVAVDAKGSLYVAGVVARPGTDGDAALVKLASGGGVVWKRYVDGKGLYDAATAVTLGPDKNVYVAGFVRLASEDVLVARYSPAGVQDWQQTWDNPAASGDDDAWDIAVSRGGVAVAGNTDQTWNSVYSTFNSYGLVLKYEHDGTALWSRVSDGYAPWGEFSDVAITRGGAVFAAGAITCGPTDDYKALSPYYDAAGTFLGALELPVGYGRGGFEAMQLVNDATAITTGYAEARGGGNDVILTVWTPSGPTSIVTTTFGIGVSATGTDVACTADGIYVGASVSLKAVVIKY